MLIDLHRIINLSCLQPWQRLLLTGMLASLLLHALLFDIWRGQLGAASHLARPGLNVQLRALPQLLEAPVVAPESERAVLPAQAPVRSAALASAGAVEPPRASVVSPAVEVLPRPASPAVSQESPGLRPLNLSEGKVAYRLALLAELPAPALEVPATGVVLELGLEADGRLAGVQVKRGAATPGLEQQWQDWLRQGAARVAVPAVLHGQPNLLEIELLP